MILEEEAFEKFGYYPSDLSLKSGKKILVGCDDCGNIREIRKCDYRALCKSCAFKGERNYMYGRTGESAPRFDQHPSEEIKQKIRNANKGEKSVLFGKHRTEEIRKKISENHADFKGEKSPNWKGGLVMRKGCGCDGDETCQFVPLCRSCNTKVNSNREMWEKKIKDKMKPKGFESSGTFYTLCEKCGEGVLQSNMEREK